MSAIKVGDLVMTVRWPHRHFGDKDARPGTPFTVTAIAPCWCVRCGADFGLGAWTGVIDEHGLDGAVPLPWVKKIEPDATLDELVVDECEKV